MKTTLPKPSKTDRKWYLINAEGKVLGRLATKITNLLRGKGKVLFTPHIDMGDHVVVINADKVAVTGRKLESKYYIHHTQTPGNLRIVPLKKMLKDRPFKVIREAVRSMLPKNKTRDQVLTKLHLYAGAEHQHEAQKPEKISL
jgi:large subunit ribosomal protein L13